MPYPNFLLDGTFGVRDYGEEAAIRGTTRILKATWPDCEVLYQSSDPRRDTVALADCPLRVVPAGDGSLSWRRTVRAMVKGLKPELDWPAPRRMRWAQESDCIICLPGDQYGPGRPLHPDKSQTAQMGFARRVLAMGKSLVIWGASIGPLEGGPESAPALTDVLRAAGLIVVREPGTVEYLAGLNIRDNVVRFPDPGFLMTPAGSDNYAPSKTRRPTIAVNLHPPLNCRTLHDPALVRLQDAHAGTLRRLMDSLQVNIILVPYVLSGRNGCDELSYLWGIFESLEFSHPGRVTVLGEKLDARRTLSVIRRCDALVAARMQCALAGIASGVATLFVAAGPYVAEMTQSVYGDANWCVSLSDFATAQGSEKVHELLRERKRIHAYLENVLPDIRRQALSAGQALRRVMEGKRGHNTMTEASAAGG